MAGRTYTVEEIIAYAREHSPYYREKYAGLGENPQLEELPLVDQDDFWRACGSDGGRVITRPHTDGQVFKSGGTTGNPKYSLFSAEEWSTLCETCGAYMPAGGLQNGDRVANLFYGGGLYASFLFSYSLFYFSPVKTVLYNLSGNVEIAEIAETIQKQQINCIAGLPSMIMKIVAYIRENGLENFCVKAVYFAGETLYDDQREKIRQVFGEAVQFRSIFYASNDGGAIGYFTRDCGFNEHRSLSALCKLELIDPDTQEVIREMHRPGKIYITSLFKTLLPLVRYPAGDLGEYTEPEGAYDRKFRLLGRSNEAARVGYVTLYPDDVARILKDLAVPFDGYQIVVTHDTIDRLTIRIAAGERQQDKTEAFLAKLYEERPFLLEAVQDKTVEPAEVVWCEMADLEYNARTGKLKLVIDKRMNG